MKIYPYGRFSSKPQEQGAGRCGRVATASAPAMLALPCRRASLRSRPKKSFADKLDPPTMDECHCLTVA